MSSRYITLDWSSHAVANNSRNSGNSYSSLSHGQIVDLVLANWGHAIPGQGETTLQRKIVVPVPPEGFFCPPRARLVAGMEIKAEVKTRQEGEDPYIETFVEEAEARKFNAFMEVPAKIASVVCYSAEALLENGGKRTHETSWEIVCLLASTIEEPMMPLAMARNFLEMPGGTKGEYSAKEFAESIYFHSCKRGVKVRLEP